MAKPALGSETRIAPRETAQARNIRYQGGPGCRSYASIPRGLRCEPWSGRAEDIGMNGDNRLHLGVICRQSVEEADFVWAVCVRDCTGLWIGSAYLTGALAALHSPCRRRGSELKGFLCAPGLIFGQSIVDERCGSEGTRGVWRVVYNGKGSRTRPRGRLLRRSLVAYRPAMRFARVAKKK